jgi:hypothetical protein
MRWGHAEGREALADYVGRKPFAPNLALERVGPLLYGHGHVNYRWRMVGPDGSVVMTGNKLGKTSPDGIFLT